MPEAEVIENNHHDEEVSISDAESVPDQGGDSDQSDDAGARGTGAPTLCPSRDPPRTRARACARAKHRSVNGGVRAAPCSRVAVRARTAAAGQQSNEESIEFGDEDESRDDGAPGQRPKGQVPRACPPLLSAVLCAGCSVCPARRALPCRCAGPRGVTAEPT